jgi:hypothetical protein
MIDLRKKEVENLIRRYFKEGRPDQLTKSGLKELKRMLRGAGIAEDASKILRDMINQVQAELQAEFLSKTTQNSTVISHAELALQQIIKNSDTAIKYNEAKIITAVSTALKDAAQFDNWKDAAREVLGKLNLKEHHIETEINTQQAAIDSVVRIATLENTGKRIKYTGPAPERSFCQQHIGKIYTIDEADKIINSFGQPALYYRGGYNCRHRWVPTD